MLQKEPGFPVENKLCLRVGCGGREPGKWVRRHQQSRAEVRVLWVTVEMVPSLVPSLTRLLVLVFKGIGSSSPLDQQDVLPVFVAFNAQRSMLYWAGQKVHSGGFPLRS